MCQARKRFLYVPIIPALNAIKLHIHKKLPWDKCVSGSDIFCAAFGLEWRSGGGCILLCINCSVNYERLSTEEGFRKNTDIKYFSPQVKGLNGILSSRIFSIKNTQKLNVDNS